MSSQHEPVLARRGQDAEPEVGDHFGDVAHEEAPLLNTDLPSDSAPSKSFQHLVVSMCVLFLFIVEVSQFVMIAPLQQVLEDRICGDIYPDHELGVVANPDDRCKGKSVQKQLAMLRSWDVSAQMFVPLFVQIPFGIIADKYGRRPVLFLSLLGTGLQTAWVLLVLSLPGVFSAWSILYGSIAYLVGGGGSMAAAMIWTLIADAIPVAKRTSIFYVLYAMILVLAVVVNPISALLLTINPWIALCSGFAIFLVGIFASLLVPETLALRQMADSNRPRGAGFDRAAALSAGPPRTWVEHAVFTVQNDMGHIWRFVFASKSVMVLTLAYALNYAIKLNAASNLLQYMTKRFDWRWSTATYVQTVDSVTALVALLVILPTGSWILVNKRGYGPLRRDLLLSRISVLFVIGGSLLTAFAPIPWLFVISLVITSLGVGFSTLCRALLNAIVEPHTVATLNTTMSMMETVMGLVTSPVLGWLLSQGIELGGPWMGLPFIVCGGMALLSGILIAGFRLPMGFAQAD